MEAGKGEVVTFNEIKFNDYNVKRKGIAHSGVGEKRFCQGYAYCKSNPSYNYYRDVSCNSRRIGMTSSELGKYMQPCSKPPSEVPLPLQPYIGVEQSASVTPKAVLPRTINYRDRMEADSFYTLCQYNRAFYKEIPLMRPWDWTYFTCGHPMYEQRSLTDQAKIRQEIPYKHPLVQPVTLCRTYGYRDAVGQHRYVPNISQGVETAFIP